MVKVGDGFTNLEKAMVEQDEEDSQEKEEERMQQRERNHKVKKEIAMHTQREQDKNVLREFKRYTNRRKIVQALLILVLVLCIASFFLVTYILNIKVFQLMTASINDLYLVQGRLNCAENALNSMLEQ